MLSTFAVTSSLLQIKTDNCPVFKNYQFYFFFWWDLENSLPHWHLPQSSGPNHYWKNTPNTQKTISQTSTELPTPVSWIWHYSHSMCWMLMLPRTAPSLSAFAATHHTHHPFEPDRRTHLTGDGRGQDPLLTTWRFACVFPQDQPCPVWVPVHYFRHDSSSQKDGTLVNHGEDEEETFPTPVPPNVQMPLSFTFCTDNSDSIENAWLRQKPLGDAGDSIVKWKHLER